MKVLIAGPQHSCTRLFFGLIDRHPDVSLPRHLSVPGNMDNEWVWLDISDDDILSKYDKILIIDRDSNCIDRSNERDYNLNGISEVSKNLITESMETIIHKKGLKWFGDNVVIASFESLFSYKNMYLTYLFLKLGLDPAMYDYKSEGNYQPLEADGKPYWFSVDLEIKDTNKKYFK